MSVLIRICKRASLSRAAFSLIEFMAALAIGLIMLTLLYGSITRTYKSVSSIEQTIDIHSALALYLERFEKDVTGAFVPTQALLNMRSNEQKDKRTGVQKEKETKKEESKKPDLRAIFLLKNMKNSAAGELSFITTSALSVYNKPASPLVRVIYKLEKAKSETGSQEKLWSLMRYESPELNYDRLKNKLGKDVRGYEILGNIEKFAIDCSARSESDKSEKNKSASFEKFSGWDSDKRKQENLLLLPNFVHCTGTIREGRKTVSFEYMVPVYAYNSQLAMDAKKEEQPIKSTDKQNEAKDEKGDGAQQSSLLANLLKGSVTSSNSKSL